MSELDSIPKNKTQNLTLYSAKAIGGATFLGGPLAGGYLISENFKALNNQNLSRKSLLTSILATIVIFAIIFLLPEEIMNKIPNQIIPFIYSAIIWAIVQWKQGEILDAHKQNNNAFFSGWRAAGVGFISLIIFSIGIFGMIYLSPDNEVYQKYDLEIAKFSENEKTSLVFYEHLESDTKYSLLNELDYKVIPKWKENVEIIHKINAFENLPAELLSQNEKLLRYSELRVKAFELFRKSITEESDQYDQQLHQLHAKIDKELKELN